MTTIAQLVLRCMDAFERARQFHSDDGLDDEFGRFRIWAANVSAHTTGRRSLQHRLRESSYLSKTVTDYLTDLLVALDIQRWQQSLIDSGDEDDAELFGVAQNVRCGDSEDEAVEEVGNIVTCLMRVSKALRNPAKIDQVRYALDTSVKHFEPHDIEHVRSKFPQAAENTIQTLGRAISRHRQYFKYREEHHQKLSHGINEGTAHIGERPSTVATSLVLDKGTKSVAQMVEADTESVYTATSYATTVTGETHLRLPPLPEAGANGQPFECPLCYHIIETSNEHAWRQHLYEDLPPYVCIEPACQISRRQFSRRREWRRHVKEHTKYWACPFECPDSFHHAESFTEHLTKSHASNVSDSTVETLLSSCKRIDENTEATNCPLCMQERPSFKSLLKHLGHHMEQLALFALPNHVYGEVDNVDAESSGHESASGHSEIGINRVRNLVTDLWQLLIQDDPSWTADVSHRFVALIRPSDLVPPLQDVTGPTKDLSLLEILANEYAHLIEDASARTLERWQEVKEMTRPLIGNIVDVPETCPWRTQESVSSFVTRPKPDEIVEARGRSTERQSSTKTPESDRETLSGTTGLDTDTGDGIRTAFEDDTSNTDSNKKHKCPHCSTEFTRHHNLKTHLLTHSQELPYACQTCQARFRRLHDLKRHGKLHSGERPHLCRECGRQFARADALGRHQKGSGGCSAQASGADGLENFEQTSQASQSLEAGSPSTHSDDEYSAGQRSSMAIPQTWPPLQPRSATRPAQGAVEHSVHEPDDELPDGSKAYANEELDSSPLRKIQAELSDLDDLEQRVRVSSETAMKYEASESPTRQTRRYQACIRCHQNKIRCIPGSQGPPCERCRRVGVGCQFKPVKRPETTLDARASINALPKALDDMLRSAGLDPDTASIEQLRALRMRLSASSVQTLGDQNDAGTRGNHAIQDIQMQLMLLEQLKKKRELMAMQDSASSSSLPVGEAQLGHGDPPAEQAHNLQHDRPFQCDKCPQSFNRYHDLKRHARIHLAIKPFPCGYCDKSFSRKDALKRHVLVKGCGKAADMRSEVKGSENYPSPEPGSQIEETTRFVSGQA